ncbi:hypothetical protein Tco_0950257 [Tanacetum coccineum]
MCSSRTQLFLVLRYHILERVNCVLRIYGLYTSRLLDAACKKVMNLLKKGLLRKIRLKNLLERKLGLRRSIWKSSLWKISRRKPTLRQKNHMNLSYDVLINQNRDEYPKDLPMFLKFSEVIRLLAAVLQIPRNRQNREGVYPGISTRLGVKFIGRSTQIEGYLKMVVEVPDSTCFKTSATLIPYVFLEVTMY